MPTKRRDLVSTSVHGQEPRKVSKRSMLDLMFVEMFKNLVYPQIWEDPEVDIEALAMKPGERLVAIASGGCNVLNYLTAEDIQITALDLNSAHIALNRLKHAAIRHLPDHDSLFQFLGKADVKDNNDLYRRHISPHLDETSRRYWEGFTLQGQRYKLFTRNFYRFGMLGKCIGGVHLVCKLNGVRPQNLLTAKSREEQRVIYDTTIGPLFERGWIKAVCNMPISVYALGIPPAQFEELRAAGGGDMAKVLDERLERLACNFDIKDNYFAWQAFGRRYDAEGGQAVPRYLKAENYDTLRDRVGNITLKQETFTQHLAGEPDTSIDGFNLLDAQDWMSPAQLTELWTEITRTGRPGARAIFRTGGVHSILPGRVPEEILSQWSYDPEASRELYERDRSSIYGGYHLYTKRAD